MNWINWMKGLGVVMVAGLLLGCAQTGSNGSPLPTDGKKMVDIYYGAAGLDEKAVNPDERVETLCRGLETREARRSCQQRAEGMGLVVDEAALLSDAPLGEKVVGTQPPPLYVDYNRTAENEVRNLFPRLPNPDIGIYIYPHLATKQEVPIPGYATVIPLYQKVQYALPGESTEPLVP
ncbi:MAG: TIGR03751 family conjugal transfer lipoprotein [Thalassospira sp.]|uniref:TIGR03751 family conjugal transfer lipoprotein n=1 Tax=Thalassospira sp. TaxID=1912094 RepID=UPI003A83E4E3